MPDPARPQGSHNIIKHPKYIGACLDCGAKGDWESIRSKPCPKNPLPISQADDVSMTDPAKEAKTSSEEVACPKTSEAEAMQILEDEAMALELLEEELQLEELELEELNLELKTLEEKPLKRPPATPCTAAPSQPAKSHLVR